MLTIQQLMKAIRKLQNSKTTATNVVDLAKYLKNTTSTTASTTTHQAIMTSSYTEQESKYLLEILQTLNKQREQEKNETTATDSSQNFGQTTQQRSANLSQISQSNVNGSDKLENLNSNASSKSQEFSFHRNQQIQNFYQQQLLHFHTQQNNNQAKQQQTQIAMSSLAAAAEPNVLKQQHDDVATKVDSASSSGQANNSNNGISCHDDKGRDGAAAAAPSENPCFNTGTAEIIKFMELIGNLKHTKRTGWVLRDVNDCESISGHMYRMSMMTFLLDGSEGLNQIRCMELALVHDLAESLVGDITPFCGIAKSEKRAMEFKAMDDICKMIEPRGKRIMELFEEYEHGESAESKFVKDLDRLDMVMQAFEYEKRDNCLLKHQEFFDSTEGKFNHPFVKKLIDEICAQRNALAQIKGAKLPPSIQVPDMDDTEDLRAAAAAAAHNGHCGALSQEKQKKNSNSS